ncbi:hypothetical protein SMICM17S_01309 [Streptomyces microflavus]
MVLLGRRQGTAALAHRMADLIEALDRLWTDEGPRDEDAAWWAAHLLGGSLLRVPYAPYLGVLRVLAGRITRRSAATGGPASPGRTGSSGPGSGGGSGCPRRTWIDLLRRLVPADAVERTDGDERYLDAVARRLTLDATAVPPLLCRWFTDERPLLAGPGEPDPELRPTVAAAAQALLHARRALAVDDLTNAPIATPHARAGELLAALAEDEPTVLCRAVERAATRTARPAARPPPRRRTPPGAGHRRGRPVPAALRRPRPARPPRGRRAARRRPHPPRPGPADQGPPPPAGAAPLRTRRPPAPRGAARRGLPGPPGAGPRRPPRPAGPPRRRRRRGAAGPGRARHARTRAARRRARTRVHRRPPRGRHARGGVRRPPAGTRPRRPRPAAPAGHRAAAGPPRPAAGPRRPRPGARRCRVHRLPAAAGRAAGGPAGVRAGHRTGPGCAGRPAPGRGGRGAPSCPARPRPGPAWSCAPHQHAPDQQPHQQPRHASAAVSVDSRYGKGSDSPPSPTTPAGCWPRASPAVQRYGGARGSAGCRRSPSSSGRTPHRPA